MIVLLICLLFAELIKSKIRTVNALACISLAGIWYRELILFPPQESDSHGKQRSE